jgi:AAA+ superfamily predicted ATPase
MSNYQKEITAINELYQKGKWHNAWKVYNNLLGKTGTSWKYETVKELAAKATNQNVFVLLTINIADLILVDYHRNQVFWVCVSNDNNPATSNFAHLKWMESNREVFAEDIEDGLGYKFQVLWVTKTNENKPFVVPKYKNDKFIFLPAENIKLDPIVGGSIPIGEFGKTHKELYDYCERCANELSDLQFQPNSSEKDSESIKTAKQMSNSIFPSTFNLKDFAPESYISFLNKNKNAITGFDVSQIMSLALHTVLVGIQGSAIRFAAQQFSQSFTPNNAQPSIKYFACNEIQSVQGFRSALKEMKNTLVVLENIEVPINRRVHTHTKDEIIATLCRHMENSNNCIYIIPISKQAWKEFVAQYPLLRILFQYIFKFDAISVKMLEKHFLAELNTRNFKIDTDAWELCKAYFAFAKNTLSAPAFTYTLSTMLVKEAFYYYTLRTANAASAPQCFSHSDIQEAINDEYKPSAEENFTDVMAELNKMIGLQTVKTGISDLAALIKVNLLRNGNTTASKVPVSLNALFVGNPGTGKTTVATFIGKIYKAIGVLKSGHLVAVSRKDIVGQYIGDTDANMKDLIAKAQGGVLFIDEAYALYKKDSERDFGKEAIDVLVAELERIREHTCVILAGYPKPMEGFMTANPGLKSRFPNTLEFTDYSADELMQIFQCFLQAENFEMDASSIALMSELIGKQLQHKDENFGNARVCRNLFEKLKLIQARRITYSTGPNQNLNEFTEIDLAKLMEEMQKPRTNELTRKVGYKIGIA